MKSLKVDLEIFGDEYALVEAQEKLETLLDEIRDAYSTSVEGDIYVEGE
jgi:cell fate (sporulation/competence/biofilm development) regulator YlbF (YheA/YmcA/DUF963 family)